MQITECETKPLLNRLRDLKEWAALGFYEALAENQPWPRTYGRAYRRLYENMEVRVSDRHLLIPCDPLEDSLTEKTSRQHHAESKIVDFMHSCGLHVNSVIVEKKKAISPESADFITWLAEDMTRRLSHFGGYTHSNPDIRRLVTLGFDSMEAELDGELSALHQEMEPCKGQWPEEKEAELNLLLSLKDYSIGIRAWYGRVVAAARRAAAEATGIEREKRLLISTALGNTFLQPATNFLEGLLSVHLAWLLDGCDSIGRVDQVLGGLYEADLASGELNGAFARELLDDFFALFEEMNGWNLTIGGRTPEGPDGCNALTRELLLACERNQLRRPNVAFRINADTPPELIDLALRGLARGSGRPALYNDDLTISTLLAMELGLTPEDAREVCYGGCTETMIGGLSNVGSLEGTINLAQCLERALFDGSSPQRKQQEGPCTGRFTDFQSYRDFETALMRQIAHETAAFAAQSNEALKRRFNEGDPKPYRTFFTRDCVRNRLSFEAGGARYNWSIVSYQGSANLIDSLEVIEELVFTKREITQTELMAALTTNFEGNESLRKRLLAAAKFGNGIDRVDQRGADILRFAWEELIRYETPRGGRYLPSCILFTTYAGAGRPIGATPDGRRSGTALNDSIGSVQGRDTSGPTALLNSVTRLPLALAIGTPVLNLRFQQAFIGSAPGRQGTAALLQTYFARGGLQVQISVLDREKLINARKEPEAHSNLIVRIGGFSEFFTRLDKDLQESVIARTAHGA